MSRSWYIVYSISVVALTVAFIALDIALTTVIPQFAQAQRHFSNYVFAALPYLFGLNVILFGALGVRKMLRKTGTLKSENL